MLKRLILTLAISAGLLSPSFGAGTIPWSLSQQFDSLGKPLAGCKLYIIQAGTTSTPQNAFFDSALTLPAPNPLACDASGRLGQFFLADGSIKIRLTDKNGVNQAFPGASASGLDGILVIGPSSGGGGASPVDPTTVIATGDIKARYGTGVISGFVRANGRTIGSATSGASERANADCQALFEYLWATDANLAVSTGRGVSANADWTANKTLTLPDWRGRALAALDDMGNTAAGRLTSSYFGTAATVLGAAGGAESQMLTVAQMPSHQHGVYLKDPGHTHGGAGGQPLWGNWNGSNNDLTVTNPGAGTHGSKQPSIGAASTGMTIGSVPGVANDGLTGSVGGGGAHTIVQPTMLATIYLKL